jgi:hypothetical protein
MPVLIALFAGFAAFFLIAVGGKAEPDSGETRGAD